MVNAARGLLRDAAFAATGRSRWIRAIVQSGSRHAWITCTGKRDGAGAQALAAMSTQLLAHDMGLTYAHTPFTSVAHNDTDDPSWADTWERFFNLGDGELASSIVAPRVELKSVVDLPLHPSPALYVTRHCHEYANRHPDRYLRLTDRFRAKYYAASKSALPLHGAPGTITIAVHVRRGDVLPSGKTAPRFTPDAHVAAVAAAVMDAAKAVGPISASLYSEGRVENFASFRDMGFDLHVDECPFTTFHNLVSADVLVMSKSTYSYVAALLSHGVKLFEPFTGIAVPHFPLSTWHVAAPGVPVDRGSMSQAIETSVAARKRCP